MTKNDDGSVLRPIESPFPRNLIQYDSYSIIWGYSERALGLEKPKAEMKEGVCWRIISWAIRSRRAASRSCI